MNWKTIAAIAAMMIGLAAGANAATDAVLRQEIKAHVTEKCQMYHLMAGGMTRSQSEELLPLVGMLVPSMQQLEIELLQTVRNLHSRSDRLTIYRLAYSICINPE